MAFYDIVSINFLTILVSLVTIYLVIYTTYYICAKQYIRFLILIILDITIIPSSVFLIYIGTAFINYMAFVGGLMLCQPSIAQFIGLYYLFFAN